VKHARRMFVWTLILVVRDSAPTTAWDRTSGTAKVPTLARWDLSMLDQPHTTHPELTL
jgi:hypothetical protein